jgi:hypothetical protein
MAVRNVFKVRSPLPRGSIPAAVRLYDGKRNAAIQSTGIEMSDTDDDRSPLPETPARKALSPAAERALAEAEKRRAEYRRREASLPREIGGRGGNEPGRYGDWEVKGLTSDF